MSPNPLADRRGLRCSVPEVHLVGEVVIGFGSLEFFLEAGIWQLLAGNDSQARRLAEAITAEMSFDRKVHAFSSLYKLRVPCESDDPQFNSLIKSLFSIQDKRNGIVHAAWTYSEVLQTFTRMKASAKAKQGLRRRIHRMTPRQLEEVRVGIAKVGDKLARFIMERIQDRTWEPTDG